MWSSPAARSLPFSIPFPSFSCLPVRAPFSPLPFLPDTPGCSSSIAPNSLTDCHESEREALISAHSFFLPSFPARRVRSPCSYFYTHTTQVHWNERGEKERKRRRKTGPGHTGVFSVMLLDFSGHLFMHRSVQRGLSGCCLPWLSFSAGYLSIVKLVKPPCTGERWSRFLGLLTLLSTIIIIIIVICDLLIMFTRHLD